MAGNARHAHRETREGMGSECGGRHESLRVRGTVLAASANGTRMGEVDPVKVCAIRGIIGAEHSTISIARDVHRCTSYMIPRRPSKTSRWGIIFRSWYRILGCGRILAAG